MTIGFAHITMATPTDAQKLADFATLLQADPAKIQPYITEFEITDFPEDVPIRVGQGQESYWWCFALDRSIPSPEPLNPGLPASMTYNTSTADSSMPRAWATNENQPLPYKVCENRCSPLIVMSLGIM